MVPQVKFRPIEAAPKAKRSFDLRKKGPSPSAKEAKKRISKQRGLDDQLRRVAQDAGAVYPSSGAPKMGAGIKRKVGLVVVFGVRRDSILVCLLHSFESTARRRKRKNGLTASI